MLSGLPGSSSHIISPSWRMCFMLGLLGALGKAANVHLIVPGLCFCSGLLPPKENGPAHSSFARRFDGLPGDSYDTGQKHRQLLESSLVNNNSLRDTHPTTDLTAHALQIRLDWRCLLLYSDLTSPEPNSIHISQDAGFLETDPRPWCSCSAPALPPGIRLQCFALRIDH